MMLPSSTGINGADEGVKTDDGGGADEMNIDAVGGDEVGGADEGEREVDEVGGTFDSDKVEGRTSMSR